MTSRSRLLRGLLAAVPALCLVPIAPALAFGWQSGDPLHESHRASEAELAAVVGRNNQTPMQVSMLDANANLSGNTAWGTVSGSNSITDGAFNGANGFTSVIQNSGNNVIIQDSTVINVSFTP